MASTSLYRWHSRIGQVVCIAIIAWALSGMSHPIMSRISPRPVVMSQPVSNAAITTLVTFSATLLESGIEQFEQAQLLNIDSNTFCRNYGPGLGGCGQGCRGRIFCPWKYGNY